MAKKAPWIRVRRGGSKMKTATMQTRRRLAAAIIKEEKSELKIKSP
jgi:hypothetical protein